MKTKNNFWLIATTLVTALVAMSANSEAQLYSGFDSEGFTIANQAQKRFGSPRRTLRLGLRDGFSPNRFFAYSNRGIEAGLTHQWNQEEASVRNWHDNYGYWRYDQPTALVVPANASFQTSYGWGVGNNRSYPIHHQFGRGGAGVAGGGAGSFGRTPLFPSHSDQIGVYSVRAPW